ncbi:MAG: malto-oligosyltrehalose synthase [Burkholderiaceae bacterium]
MLEGDALLRLSERVGIATSYQDVLGQRHEASEENLRAMLHEFGIDAATPEVLAAAEARDWREPLPPVVAISAGAERWSVGLRLPDAITRVRWTLREEGGRVHRGDLDAAACAVTSEVEIDGARRRALRAVFELALPPGYHHLSLDAPAADGAVGAQTRAQDARPGSETLVISAPARCWRPPALQDEGRVWGPALQLYSLRSARNWGIGDFGDLAQVAEQWGERGAGIVGLNPLHALFTHNPAHASPYSPSSRLWLNTIYLDVEAIEDFRECEAAQRHVRSAGFQQRLERLRGAELVDYRAVSAAKHEVLQLLYAHFREEHLGATSARANAFRDFQAERGESLRLHASFEALQAQFHAADPSVWGWPVWPESCRDPRSPAVLRFQAEHIERIEYFEYLQWQTDRQLAALSRRCRERGLAVGLYLDLAVSVDRAGSDTWGHAALYAHDAGVGAPPDPFNPNGQGWGLPPLRPDRLRDDRYALFIETLRASMRHAGALRIDHVMGLMRLYWIAPGKGPRDGAYVHYRVQELLAIVALESERNHCMVIGEDLGTVADEMRAALARFEVLSYRLLYFERAEGGAFKTPAEYPREALVAISTHDLATLEGWWTGRDLAVRVSLVLFPDPAVYEEQLAGRVEERVRLLLALQREGLLPEGVALDPSAATPLTSALVEAVHAYLAGAPSRVMLVQLEDALGVVDQPNMPGTTDEHPNWRQKLPLPVAAMASDARVQSLAARLAKIRPHAPLRSVSAPRAEAVVPRATYRLQFHKDFGFDAALRVLPYLQRLGISHVYCSPLMRARPGSMHGYDIVVHDEINPELGGRVGFDRFAAAARAHGMGLLLDMVPNHMGVLGADNPWWMDVLENGAVSAYARYFDIDWHPVNRELDGKVLVPVLGEHYGAVLEGGQLKLCFEPLTGSFALRYFEHRFPIDPSSYAPLLERAAERVVDADAQAALSSLAAAFRHLPPREADEGSAVAERARDKELLKARLADLLPASEGVMVAIEAAVAHFNQPDALAVLHEEQAYRLAYWRVAADEINYRRFFDISELAALRIEEPAVFEATQGFALELAAAGVVDGLRIDHPDGLHDPAQYFERLQQGYARRADLALPQADVTERPLRPLYVVAEKIAAAHEEVPEQWQVHGTTGYRFANVVNGVLIDTGAHARFDRIWSRFSGERRPFEELAYEGKHAIMRSSLASELTMLATELLRIARGHRATRDYTYNTLRNAVAEVAACMPVYRTYIVEEPSAQDRRFIDWAVAHARRKSQAGDTSIFGFVHETLLARAVAGASAELQQQVRHFALRFQQFSAPVTAKGVEDTAFYRYSRLVSQNEVGGDPGSFGMTVHAFHGASADRAARWPHTIIATSTHDNKRSEDVRNRIDVLSEMPAAWRLWLRRWSGSVQLQRIDIDGRRCPSAADEYLLYQTLLGTLPVAGLDDASLDAYRERIEHYALKAAREAKLHTSWISPDAGYEAALAAFVRSVLVRVRPNPLLTDLQAQAATLAWFGALNSLSMVLLKYTSPGVPDLYQGNELMDLSLVDPDNRRPVDYGLRARWLDELAALDASGSPASGLGLLLRAPHDGRLKLWITWRLLALRVRMPELFRDGGYLAITVDGARSEHVIAYQREHEGQRLFAVAARLFARLGPQPGEPPLGEAAWGDTSIELPMLAEGTRLRNLLTGETHEVVGGVVRLAQLFATLPVAALVL